MNTRTPVHPANSAHGQGRRAEAEAGAEGAGAEGAGAEGARAEGAGAEGARAEGARAEGAGAGAHQEAFIVCVANTVI